MSRNKELKMRKDKQENIINQFGKNNRVTNTRLDIIECLSDGHHQHTVNDIISHLKRKQTNLNVATVYNNLKSLLSQGVIDVYPNYDSQNQRYELIDKNNFHIHIRDFKNDTEEYETVPRELIDFVSKMMNNKGYEIHNLKIEILVKKK